MFYRLLILKCEFVQYKLCFSLFAFKDKQTHTHAETDIADNRIDWPRGWQTKNPQIFVQLTLGFELLCSCAYPKLSYTNYFLLFSGFYAFSLSIFFCLYNWPCIKSYFLKVCIPKGPPAIRYLPSLLILCTVCTASCWM